MMVDALLGPDRSWALGRALEVRVSTSLPSGVQMVTTEENNPDLFGTRESWNALAHTLLYSMLTVGYAAVSFVDGPDPDTFAPVAVPWSEYHVEPSTGGSPDTDDDHQNHGGEDDHDLGVLTLADLENPWAVPGALFVFRDEMVHGPAVVYADQDMRLPRLRHQYVSPRIRAADPHWSPWVFFVGDHATHAPTSALSGWCTSVVSMALPLAHSVRDAELTMAYQAVGVRTRAVGVVTHAPAPERPRQVDSRLIRGVLGQTAPDLAAQVSATLDATDRAPDAAERDLVAQVPAVLDSAVPLPVGDRTSVHDPAMPFLVSGLGPGAHVQFAPVRTSDPVASKNLMDALCHLAATMGVDPDTAFNISSGPGRNSYALVAQVRRREENYQNQAGPLRTALSTILRRVCECLFPPAAGTVPPVEVGCARMVVVVPQYHTHTGTAMGFQLGTLEHAVRVAQMLTGAAETDLDPERVRALQNAKFKDSLLALTTDFHGATPGV